MGAPVEEIRPGDVVWIPPGQKHWHTTDLSRIAGSFVIARNTAFTFKDKAIDVRESARRVRDVPSWRGGRGRTRRA
jgi:uncharacterized RmlC-like cupin family protein